MTIAQQLWQMVAEMNMKVENHRRESSIPGPSSTQENTLFGRDELSTLALNSNVNSQGTV